MVILSYPQLRAVFLSSDNLVHKNLQSQILFLKLLFTNKNCLLLSASNTNIFR